MAGGGKLYANREGLVSKHVATHSNLPFVLHGEHFLCDSASFSGVQTFSPFLKQFGSYNEKKATWALPTRTVSLMNSLPLLGKFLGSMIVGPVIERFGHLQVTSHTPAQFIVGRMFIYIAVGLVENVVPTYESEICPAPLRGFCVGSIQLFLTFGSLIAGIANEYLSGYTGNEGWMIATGMQGVPAVIILLGLPFTPNSPRWLINNNRREEALSTLHRIRPQRLVDEGLCELEISVLENSETTHEKQPWSALFNSANRRRTGIALTIMALQQLTGVTFSSSYGTTFYKQVGLGSMAFTYAAVNNGVSVVTAAIGMVLFDTFGRRDVTFHGCWVQTVFLCLIGGLGSKTNRTSSDTHGMVASFIIYAAVLHATLGPSAYITAAEVGTASLREKTMAISTALNVVVSFVVVYTTPYLLSTPGANLGPKLGYIWAGFAFVGAVWVWFCMPELKGRSLEEVDELFAAKLPAWKFKSYKTHGRFEVEMSPEEKEGKKEIEHTEV
ncbi:sugar transporter [Talaromyces pinophilus]|uniref:Sugar transporter n=1 Tax=Talaromyces pinophilus TaxID=128442 RepID=A0A510NW12_TALPI|nr:sugar transporter [Talaromyces pinophilus]